MPPEGDSSKQDTSEGEGKNTGNEQEQGNQSQKPGDTKQQQQQQQEDKENKDKADDTEEARFTQKDLDRLLAKTRSEEKAKFDKKLQEDKEKADQAKAEEEGKFKELYDKEKAKTADLTAKLEIADRYAKRLNEIIDGEVKAWPVEVKKLDPGADNLQQRTEWVENSRDLAKRLMSLSGAPDGEHKEQQKGSVSLVDQITEKYRSKKPEERGQTRGT